MKPAVIMSLRARHAAAAARALMIIGCELDPATR